MRSYNPKVERWYRRYNSGDCIDTKKSIIKSILSASIIKRSFESKTFISIKKTFPMKKIKEKLSLKLFLIKKPKSLFLERSALELCSVLANRRHYKYQRSYNYKNLGHPRYKKSLLISESGVPCLHLFRPFPILLTILAKPKFKAYKSLRKKKR